MKTGYLYTKNKSECFGCEACVQICANHAIELCEDKEGFRYPFLDKSKCIKCGLCHHVCPYENMPVRYDEDKLVLGGYIKDKAIRADSTSGGAFSAIVDAWCDKNYVVFGAEADGIHVFHSYIENKAELWKFRKSKYLQSSIGNCYSETKKFLIQRKKVLFSGTPCQIAGLRAFLGKDYDNLLTVEVICEGVPSPLYIRKYERMMKQKYGSTIKQLDYRYKDADLFKRHFRGKWDFQVMYTLLKNGKVLKKNRWFNPFWSIWLKHLMSRPSCYKCKFASPLRGADITLGDLWGVHIYCPDLYGNNAGTSLVVCNSEKGKKIISSAWKSMYGRELDFSAAIKYQAPMRKTIDYNPQRTEFIRDLQDEKLGYDKLSEKWASKPTLKLLFQKYVWGNRQKVFTHNLVQCFKTQFRKKRR